MYVGAVCHSNQCNDDMRQQDNDIMSSMTCVSKRLRVDRGLENVQYIGTGRLWFGSSQIFGLRGS